MAEEAIPLGRNFENRRLGATVEKVEAVLLSEIDSIFEDAVVFALTSKTTTPVETLLAFLIKYSSSEKKPIAAPPAKGTKTLNQEEIMKDLDPMFVYLARVVVKGNIPNYHICQSMAEELQRLVDSPAALNRILGREYISRAVPKFEKMEDSTVRLIY